jgi:hypothetical protein
VQARTAPRTIHLSDVEELMVGVMRAGTAAGSGPQTVQPGVEGPHGVAATPPGYREAASLPVLEYIDGARSGTPSNNPR